MFRLARPDDFLALAAIEQRSNPYPLSRHALQSALCTSNRVNWLIEPAPETIAGFIFMQVAFDHADIIHLATDLAYQGRGHATALLTHTLADLRARGVTDVFLEVRTRNMTARRLYERCGFVEVGIRKGYYATPHEDAIVMRCDTP